MQEEKSKNYPSITTAINHDDAVKYSFCQLEWMRDNDITSFHLLDFVHLSDKTICNLLSLDKNDPLFETLQFPLTTRRSFHDLKKHIYNTRKKNKTQIQKEEMDSDLFLLEHLSKQKVAGQKHGTQHTEHKCMGISKTIFLGSAGASEKNNYQDNLTEGYHSFCQQAFRNMAEELSKSGSPDEKLFGKHGFVYESDRDKKRVDYSSVIKKTKTFY